MIPLLPAALAFTLAASPSLAPERPDWTPVLASALVPGAGQHLQGQPAKALTHFGAAVACLAAFTYAQLQATDTTGPTGTAPNVRTLAGAGLLGLALWSPLDAWLFQQRPEAPQTPLTHSSSGGN
ncbi:hypothetical protein D3C86_911600 [compost metagenome]